MNAKNETPVLIENPTTYRFAGGCTQVLLSGEQTDGAFAMLAIDKSPGASTPRHFHERQPNLLRKKSNACSPQRPARVLRLAQSHPGREIYSNDHRLLAAAKYFGLIGRNVI